MQNVDFNERDELQKKKSQVQAWMDYYYPNNTNYRVFRNFVLKNTISTAAQTVLEATKKPILSFNVLESYIDRNLGEFEKNEPSIVVRHDYTEELRDEDVLTEKVIENICRKIKDESDKDLVNFNVYKEIITGGFSVFKIVVDYKNSMAFEQEVKLTKSFSPVLCGFDPMATLPHKGDGEYCFELYPVYEDVFKKENPNLDLSNIDYVRDNSMPFNWAYMLKDRKILVICDFYEKKKKKTRIYEILKNGERKVVTKKQYEEIVENWDGLDLPPVIINKRWTFLQTIVRYRFIENKIIEEKETIFDELPLIFAPGKMDMLQPDNGGDMTEITKPMLYHAQDLQRLKDFAGQCLANELENMVQHRLIVPLEAIPTQYLDAYKDTQIPNTLIYKHFNKDDPNQTIPPPQLVQRPPIPAEIPNTFTMCDKGIETLLGTYDASLGINDNQLSGKAIALGSMNSNAVSKPYIIGYLQGLNQAFQVIKGIIPKIYRTPKTVPMKLPDGKETYIKINQPGGINLDYDPNVLNIEVKVGPNFEIQRYQAFEQIISLMKVLPTFAQFIQEEGGQQLLDNLDFRGIDELKVKYPMFLERMKEQQEKQMQLMQQQMQNDPRFKALELEQQKLVMKAQQDYYENLIKLLEVENKSHQLKIDEQKLNLEAVETHNNNLVRINESRTERFSKEIDMALKTLDQDHRHQHEIRKLEHEIELAEKNSKQKNVDFSEKE
jgi:hypothetical protein